MLGPSRCQLCEAQEETMEHLRNSCIFTSWLWDTFATIFQKIDRDKESIANSLSRWRRNFLDNEVLNIAWALMPSFIIWNISIERNKRIFKNEKNPALRLYEQIVIQLKETVSTTVRNLPKNPPSVGEFRILQLLDLQGIIPQGLEMTTSMRDKGEKLRHPPLKVF